MMTLVMERETESATSGSTFDEYSYIKMEQPGGVTWSYEDPKTVSAQPVNPVAAKKAYGIGKQISSARASTKIKHAYLVSISSENSGAAWDDPIAPWVLTIEIRSFLRRLYHLACQGLDRMAMDSIINFFDDALAQGDTEKCARALEELDPERLDASMMLVALHITGKAKDWLNHSREAFYSRALAALAKERGLQQAERLLSKHR